MAAQAQKAKNGHPVVNFRAVKRKGRNGYSKTNLRNPSLCSFLAQVQGFASLKRWPYPVPFGRPGAEIVAGRACAIWQAAQRHWSQTVAFCALFHFALQELLFSTSWAIALALALPFGIRGRTKQLLACLVPASLHVLLAVCPLGAIEAISLAAVLCNPFRETLFAASACKPSISMLFGCALHILLEICQCWKRNDSCNIY